jgi:hypothetical protein
VLLKNPQTKDTCTLGILRDIVLSCVYALPDQQFSALGERVADKVIHQVLGDPAVLKTRHEKSCSRAGPDKLSTLSQYLG